MAKEDIVLGYGKLYYAALGTANPDETSVAFDAAWSSWTALGDTLEPVRFNMNDEWVDISTQQSMGDLKSYRTDRKPTIRTVLAEHVGATLALIWGGTNLNTAAGAAQKAYSEIKVGNEPVVSTYKVGLEVLYVASAGSKQSVRYFWDICAFMPDGDTVYDKKKETGIPVLIKVYENTGATAGVEFMTTHIVTGPVTA